MRVCTSEWITWFMACLPKPFLFVCAEVLTGGGASPVTAISQHNATRDAHSDCVNGPTKVWSDEWGLCYNTAVRSLAEFYSYFIKLFLQQESKYTFILYNLAFSTCTHICKTKKIFFGFVIQAMPWQHWKARNHRLIELDHRLYCLFVHLIAGICGMGLDSTLAESLNSVPNRKKSLASCSFSQLHHYYYGKAWPRNPCFSPLLLPRLEKQQRNPPPGCFPGQLKEAATLLLPPLSSAPYSVAHVMTLTRSASSAAAAKTRKVVGFTRENEMVVSERLPTERREGAIIWSQPRLTLTPPVGMSKQPLLRASSWTSSWRRAPISERAIFLRGVSVRAAAAAEALFSEFIIKVGLSALKEFIKGWEPTLIFTTQIGLLKCLGERENFHLLASRQRHSRLKYLSITGLLLL